MSNNLTRRKAIRITEKQEQNWNPKKVRNFLENCQTIDNKYIILVKQFVNFFDKTFDSEQIPDRVKYILVNIGKNYLDFELVDEVKREL